MTRSIAALSAFAFLAALALPACGEDKGPVAIKLGRDVCEMCGMIISDPRFLTEVRLADNKIHKFDDVGDAVNWLSAACKTPDDATEFWVIDSKNGKRWLDARKAFYRSAETPMNYGFGAVEEATPDSISFEAMRAKTSRAKYACKSASPTDAPANPRP